VQDGAIRWLTEYPRVDLQNENPDRNTQHLFRDLTPCLLHRDLVIVAPLDCDRLFALDANTGDSDLGLDTRTSRRRHPLARCG